MSAPVVSPQKTKVPQHEWSAWVGPYFAWAFVFSAACLRTLDPGQTSRRMTYAFYGLAIGALSLLAAPIVRALRRRSLAPVHGVLFSGLVVGAGASVAATLFPRPPLQESPLHRSLRGVLERRGTSSSYMFRGVTINNRANRIGWMDSEAPTGPSPIIFIGDSFLESRSSRNLAALVEEKLASVGNGPAVVNLSKEDTEPSIEYRNRFYEFAFRRKPSRVVLFLFAGNDFQWGYSYEPYRHPSVWVTPQALWRGLALGPRAVALLANAYVRASPIVSRQDVSDRAPGIGEELGDLIYLTAMAYGTDRPHQRSKERGDGLLRATGGLLARALGVDPRAFDLQEEARTAASLASSSERGRVRPKPSPPRAAPTPLLRYSAAKEKCHAVDWAPLWKDYRALFALRRELRLNAIARFIAERYCGVEDARPFVEVLSAQSDAFKEELTWGPDMPYALFPAVAAAVSGEEQRPWIDEDEATRLGHEYERLVLEMDSAAKSKGVAFTIVLIPSAFAVDEEFRRFWSGLREFWKGPSGSARVQAEFARTLGERVDVIDLAAHPELLQGAYWPFDGHFNEKGNSAVAAFLAEELAAREAVKR